MNDKLFVIVKPRYARELLQGHSMCWQNRLLLRSTIQTPYRSRSREKNRRFSPRAFSNPLSRKPATSIGANSYCHFYPLPRSRTTCGDLHLCLWEKTGRRSQDKPILILCWLASTSTKFLLSIALAINSRSDDPTGSTNNSINIWTLIILRGSQNHQKSRSTICFY